MEIDLQDAAAEVASGRELRTDVCVVGGGIAGLLLAQRLAERGVDVLLLESGDRSAEIASTRVEQTPRGLGGTSATWGGQLLPVASTSGWPFALEEITPYYGEIEQRLGIDTMSYEAPLFAKQARVAVPLEFAQGPCLRARLSKFVPFSRRNLAFSAGRALLEHPRARVALRATALSLVLTADGQRVEHLLVATAANRTVRVVAREIVLAAGTVETCRLLLASRSVVSEGVGNRHDQVGRRVHDHLTLRAAVFTGAARAWVLRHFRPWIVGGLRGTVHSLKLESGPACVEASALPFGMAHFTFEEPPGSGAAALRRGLQQWQRGGLAAVSEPGQLRRALGAVVALEWGAQVQGRRWISSRGVVTLQLNTAQQVSDARRIRLGSDTDALGRAVAEGITEFAMEDLDGLRRLGAVLREGLQKAGCGQAHGAVWEQALLRPTGDLPGLDDARHMMGGACMGTDPRTSVVDSDLRVHGVDNLSLASAAVFPDGRAQLPTMTLMALSMRLADRIAATLARGR